MALQVSAAFLSMTTQTLQHSDDKQRQFIGSVLNQVALGFVTGALFCDVIKMNFGLDPALAFNATATPTPQKSNY